MIERRFITDGKGAFLQHGCEYGFLVQDAHAVFSKY